MSWGLSCHVKCLVSAMPVVSSVSVFQEEPGDLSGVPEEYHDLQAVFSRSRAASLPPIDRMTAALTLSRVACLLVVDFIPCLLLNARRSRNA